MERFHIVLVIICTYFVVLHFVRGLLANEYNVSLLTQARYWPNNKQEKYESTENRANT